MTDWTNERMNERRNERKKEQMNKRMNKSTDQRENTFMYSDLFLWCVIIPHFWHLFVRSCLK